MHDPDDLEIDAHADWQWRRQEAALKSLTISEVLAEVDHRIASEPDAQHHPLYSLAAHALDRTTQPGSAESLQSRFHRMIDHAIEALIEARLADPNAWVED
jgi:hypothetical protein